MHVSVVAMVMSALEAIKSKQPKDVVWAPADRWHTAGPTLSGAGNGMDGATGRGKNAS